ncbi:cadherin-1-like [Littorina saxatilis]|uniref:cadherin-1-like n=1 Tax=Littorina saxatilis TaxID=31220 RepID=UPI0038B59264
MQSTWTIKLISNTSSAGLRTFFLAALRFEGTPTPNQCSGQNQTCNVTLGKVMDLEYLRDQFGFTGLTVKYELVCSGGRRDPFDLLLSAVGEFEPGFNTSPLRINVTENTKVGTAVISLYDYASDKDVGEFIRSFDLVTNTSLFSMEGRYGNISVKSPLDFESLSAEGKQVVQLTVRIGDSRNRRSNDTLIITITDADDLPPVFSLKCPDNEAPPCEANYTASVSPSCVGTVNNIEPHDIAARDGDTLAYGIEYSLKSGPNQPPFEQYLTMENSTGKLTITKALGGAYGAPAKLVLIVQATEVSPSHRSSTAGLVVCVQEGGAAQTAKPEVKQTAKPEIEPPEIEPPTSNKMTLTWIVLGSLFGLLFLVLACCVLFVLFCRKKKRKPSDVKAELSSGDREKSSGAERSVEDTTDKASQSSASANSPSD